MVSMPFEFQIVTAPALQVLVTKINMQDLVVISKVYEQQNNQVCIPDVRLHFMKPNNCSVLRHLSRNIIRSKGATSSSWLYY